MDRIYLKCTNAKEAVEKLEMILLPGNSHSKYYYENEYTFYFGEENKADAIEEYEWQLGRFKSAKYESLTHYVKNKNGRWTIKNKKSI